MNAQLTLEIIRAILIYGPNAVTVISKLLETEVPTPEQVRALFIGKDPAEYF